MSEWTLELVIRTVTNKLELNPDPQRWTATQMKRAIAKFSITMTELRRKKGMPITPGSPGIDLALIALAAADRLSAEHILAAIEAHYEAYLAAQERLKQTVDKLKEELGGQSQ